MALDIVLSALLLLSTAWGLVWFFRAAGRAERRCYAKWHDDYFRRGGLIRALMRGWTGGTPRLTDQREPD